MTTEDNGKVISLVDRPPKEAPEETEEVSFEEVIKKNAEKQRRIREDRAKANRGVIRSYRLKK